jgi:hypothetical protein
MLITKVLVVGVAGYSFFRTGEISSNNKEWWVTYKKRAKGGWSGGKRYKKQSNRDERQYEKEELSQALQEEFEGPEFRYKHVAKRKELTEEQRLEKQKARYLFWIVRWKQHIERRATVQEDSWLKYIRGVVESYKATVRKIEKKLEELREEE